MTAIPSIPSYGPCDACGRHREKWERWNWVWSDIGVMAVVAVYCPCCAKKRGMKPRGKIRNRP